MLIGFSGKLGAGKDYVAHLFFERLSLATKLAFADPLKRRVMEEHGLSFEEVYLEKTQRSRTLLQSCGSSCRALDADYWVHRMKQEMRLQLHRGFQHLLFTDVRYPNEASLLQEMGSALGMPAVLIRVVSNERTALRLKQEGSSGTHASETALDDYPFPITIYNCLRRPYLAISSPSSSALIPFESIAALVDFLLQKLLT